MKAQDQELLQELKTLLEFFENNDQVEVLSKTLEEYLLAPIEYLPIPDRRSKKKTTTWIINAVLHSCIINKIEN